MQPNTVPEGKPEKPWNASGANPAQRLVVAIGGANMDIAAHGDAALRPADSNPGSITFSPGGVARNVAENLSRLGVPTRLVSVVGDDAMGQVLLARCREAGLDVNACEVLTGQRTGTYLSMHGPDGDMALAVNDMALLEHLTPEHLAGHAASLRGSAVWMVDCNLPADTLAWLMDNRAALIREQSPAIFADAVSVAKCGRLLSCLPNLFALKVNAMEAGALTGLPVGTIEEALQVAAALGQGGPQWVVITLGKQGAVWCDTSNGQAQSAFVAARPTDIVSATGAGDALLAGLVWAYLAGWSLERATAWGMACAELTLKSPFANASELGVEAVLQQMQLG